VIERHERCTAISAERIGLRVPIEIARPERIPMVVVVRRGMVGADELQTSRPIVLRRSLALLRPFAVAHKWLEESEEIGHRPRL
jgi:hypothetical protein